MTTRWNVGQGTAAALQFGCPHCSSARGVRCVEPGDKVRRHVHSQRMKLASARTTGVREVPRG